MTRVLLDTCAVIDLITDPASLGDGGWDIINDPDNRLYMSAETGKELVVHFNNKRLLSKFWKTAEEMLASIEDDYHVAILAVTRDVDYTYARLRLNETQDHRDPSDHIIISHAITERPEVCFLPQARTGPDRVLTKTPPSGLN